jgi:23S rRNA (adenine2503-C2)-methyltransferase
MSSLADVDPDALARQIDTWGFKPSHARRILLSYYTAAGNVAWAAIRAPEALRRRIAETYGEAPSPVAARQEGDDGTVKLLLRFADGKAVESVVMPAYRRDRAAGCLSSQVGCALACDFCATAQSGFARNLTPGEMVEQFLQVRGEAGAAGRRLQTVVFMGMGEPLLNLDNVIAAIRRIAGPGMGGLGWRQVTVSTVGIVPGIDALADARLGVNLAVSLHAPDDAIRADLIPAGRRFGIAEILEAADRFQAGNGGRPVSVQYCLLAGVNDGAAHARQLAALLSGRRMHVNLLHYNPTGVSLKGRAYAPSPPAVEGAFMAELRSRGVVAHFRRPRGRDIDAACGQLRRRLDAASAARGTREADA